MRDELNTPRKRSQNLLPSVYLTLLGMVQAIVLESTADRIHVISESMLAMPDLLLISLQVLVTIQVVFYLFAIYMFGIMAFVWSYGIFDALVPFVAGLLEFLMVAWIGPNTVHLYLYAGAIIGFLGAISTWYNLRRFGHEPENQGILDRLSMPVLLCPLFTASGTALVGAVLVATGRVGSSGAVAALALLSALLFAMIGGLTWQWQKIVDAPGA